MEDLEKSKGKLEPPIKGMDDYVAEAMKIGAPILAAGAVAYMRVDPVIAVACKELFNKAIPSASVTTERKWRKNMAEAVIMLHIAVQNIVDDLHTNDKFLNLIILINEKGEKTMEDNEQILFKNAIYNSIDPSISYSLKKRYVSVLDDLSGEHVVILKLLLDNKDESSVSKVNTYK